MKLLRIWRSQELSNATLPRRLSRSIACWQALCSEKNWLERFTTVQGEASRIILLVTRTLERLGILYAVGGSLASSLHGVMRSTLDVDIVAEMQPEHIQPLVEALSKEFYADDEMMRDTIEHQSSFNLIHYETAFKVDIFIRKSRAFDQMQLNRRRRSGIASNPEESVYVTSPEDTILAKLEWYRMGGEVSDRQWRDTPWA